MQPQDLEHALAAAKTFLPNAKGAVILVHTDAGAWLVGAASYQHTRDKAATLEEMRSLVEGAPVAAKEWQRQVIAEATS